MIQIRMTHIHRGSGKDPETRTTIPLQALDLAEKLIPIITRTFLHREGVAIGALTDISPEKCPSGNLIEIETGNEILIVQIESGPKQTAA